MSTPQSLTQGFIQNSAGTQSVAQNAQPLIANNGNPNTVYNNPPMGGYLPPVANAYDQWRINPGFSGGGGFLTGGFDWGIGGNGFPMPNVPSGGGGNWRPPTRPPTTPPTGGPTVTPPTGGPTVPPGGPQVGPSLLGGQRRGLGVDIGWGGTGIPNYSAISTGLPNTSGFNTSRWGMNGLLGNVIDWFLPGDAVQGGHINWANLGLGIVDQYTGLPITRGLGWLANTDWAQNSPNAVARWLRNWEGENDAAAMQDWYNQNGYTATAGTGWMADAFPWLEQQRQQETARTGQSVGAGFVRGLTNFSSAQQRNIDAFRQGGVAALEGRVNPATGRTFTAREIHDVSRQATARNGRLGHGVGLAAAGGFTPWGATAIQGDAARAMWEGMKDGIWNNAQYSNAAN